MRISSAESRHGNDGSGARLISDAETVLSRFQRKSPDFDDVERRLVILLNRVTVVSVAIPNAFRWTDAHLHEGLELVFVFPVGRAASPLASDAERVFGQISAHRHDR